MERLVSLCFVLMQWFVITLGEQTNITITMLNETDFKDIDFKNASILRYGHHRTDCMDFRKAYACIMRCLESGYDIAHSKKDCSCHCYTDKVKAKYFNKVSPNWKMPTTSKPAWAGGSPMNLNLIGGEYVYSSGEGDSQKHSGNHSEDNMKTDSTGAPMEHITTVQDGENTDDGDSGETHDGEEHSEEHNEEDNNAEEAHEEENEEEEPEGEEPEGEEPEGE